MNRRKAVVLAAALLAGGCAQDPPVTGRASGVAPGQGDYGGVQRSDLIGAHVARATGGSSARFRWVFTEREFEVSAEGGALPPEVAQALLGAGADTEARAASQIEGKWTLDGRRLLLSDIRWTEEIAAGSPTAGGHSAPDVELAPFKTPVVRFEFGATQYVLGPAER